MTAKRQVAGIVLLAAAMVITVVLLARMEIVRVETDRERVQQYELTFQEAERINRNSNLGLEYMSVLEGEPTPDDMPWDMDRGHPMAAPGVGSVIGYYYVFPYDSDNYRLAEVSFSERGGHDFFGIRAGGSLSYVHERMVELGYRLDGSEKDGASYSKYLVSVFFAAQDSADSNRITSITVSHYDPYEPDEGEFAY